MVIGSFKSAVAREVNLLRDTPVSPVWQRGFYDHVIRDEADLDRVRRCLEENPLRWLGDEENPRRHARACVGFPCGDGTRRRLGWQAAGGP